MTKSKVAKITLSAVGAIMLMSLSNVASAKSVNEIIKEYYPIYNKAQQCQGIMANNGSRIDDDVYLKSGYCIKIDRQLEVKPSKANVYMWS